MTAASNGRCATVRELAPELALGIVSGPERADAIQHLDRCPDCRAFVEELVGATDAVVLLAPGAEPPPGFELRVLDHLAGASQRVSPPRRANRREVAAWVLAAACLLALAGVFFLRDEGGDGPAEFAMLRTPNGQVVGHAILYPSRDEHPAWVYLSMPGWVAWLDERGVDGEYALSIQMAGGGEERIALPALQPGREGWGGAIGADPDEIASIAVVDGEGRVLCGATT